MSDRAAILLEQCRHHVYRFDELMIAPNRQRLRISQRHLEFAGEFIHSHFANPLKKLDCSLYEDNQWGFKVRSE